MRNPAPAPNAAEPAFTPGARQSTASHRTLAPVFRAVAPAARTRRRSSATTPIISTSSARSLRANSCHLRRTIAKGKTMTLSTYQIRIRQCAAMFLVEHMRHGSWHIIESLDHHWQAEEAAAQYRADGATVTECWASWSEASISRLSGRLSHAPRAVLLRAVKSHHPER